MPRALMRHNVTKMQGANGGNTVVEVSLYDEIVGSDVFSNYFAQQGWVANAKSFEQALNAALDGLDLSTVDVVAKIKCYGGVVTEGVAMYNIIRNLSGKVASLKTQCLAIAASSASIVFLAGDVREVCSGAEVMVHNASYGEIPFQVDANALDSLAGDLRRTNKRIASLYVERTGCSLEEIVAMMDAETYLDAATALEKGFATAKTSDQAVAVVGNPDLMKMSAGIKNVSKGIQFAAAQAPAVLAVGGAGRSPLAGIALSALGALGINLSEVMGPEVATIQAMLDEANEKLEAATAQALAFQAAATSATSSLAGMKTELEAQATAHAETLEAAKTEAKDVQVKAVDEAVRAFALEHHIAAAPKMPAPSSSGEKPSTSARLASIATALVTKRP